MGVSACRNALAAVGAAKAAVDRQNELRASADRPRIRYGLALHVGDVMYGNVGGDARLDFTVIGPAVNLTSRIESMCKNLDHSPLLSAEFTRRGRGGVLGRVRAQGRRGEAADLWLERDDLLAVTVGQAPSFCLGALKKASRLAILLEGHSLRQFPG